MVINRMYENLGEGNGKLPLRTCPGCSISEPYQSPDRALVPAKPAQGLNTHYYYYYYYYYYYMKIKIFCHCSLFPSWSG